MEMVEEEAEEMDLDLDEQELQESIREQEEVSEAARSQPYSRIAMRYIEVAIDWLKSNESLLDDEDGEPESSAPDRQSQQRARRRRGGPARLPRSDPLVPAADLRQALPGGQRDDPRRDWRNSSACRKTPTARRRSPSSASSVPSRPGRPCWSHFPDHEDAIFALGTLKRLLRQVEAAFPNARAFRRPGFDTDET